MSCASFEVEAGTDREPVARVAVKMPDGSEQTGEASGDGPVDSIFSAIQVAAGVEAELREYHVAAVTGGDDALGQVTVVLREDGTNSSGQGVATDILEASARAYVRALSNLIDGSVREKPEGRAPGPESRLTRPMAE